MAKKLFLFFMMVIIPLYVPPLFAADKKVVPEHDVQVRVYVDRVYIPKQKLEEFCRRNHIIKLSLFGSALRGELNSESDIDILFKFDKEHIPGLLDISGMENALTELHGRKVDLRTPAELSQYFRSDVLAKAKVEYAF